jgi:hypothetical protein
MVEVSGVGVGGQVHQLCQLGREEAELPPKCFRRGACHVWSVGFRVLGVGFRV